MTSHSLARNAYAQSTAPIRTPRDTEFDAFARITHKLKAASRKGPGGFGLIAEALHENRRLWTILATDVADDQNRLPEQLRARLFYLAEFTRHHSARVLGEGADVDPLIEINTAVMRGLNPEGASA